MSILLRSSSGQTYIHSLLQEVAEMLALSLLVSEGGVASLQAVLQIHASDIQCVHMEGKPDDWEEIKTALGQCPQLALVVLNGWDSYGDSQDLIQMGIPLVYIIGYAQPTPARIELTQLFYRALAKQHNIYVAFGRVRKWDPILRGTKYLSEEQLIEQGHWQDRKRCMPRGNAMHWKPRFKVKDAVACMLVSARENMQDWGLGSTHPYHMKLPHMVTHYSYAQLSLASKVHASLTDIRATLGTHMFLRIASASERHSPTQLARYFVQKFGFLYMQLLWVDLLPAHINQPNPTIAAFVGRENDLEEALNMELRSNLSAEVRFECIMKRMAELRGQSLLVVNHAIEDIPEVRAYLAKRPNWHILLC